MFCRVIKAVITIWAGKRFLWTDTLLSVALSAAGLHQVMCPTSSSTVQGAVQEYWETYDSHPHLQGGFIWDWVDQGLINTATDASGAESAMSAQCC